MKEFENALGLIHSQGYFWWTSSIGTIMPKNKYRIWDFAGENFDTVCETINEGLEKYALPIFNLFENKDEAVSFLLKNGYKLNEYIKTEINPFSVVLYMITHTMYEEAEIYFNKLISTSSIKSRVKELYKELLNMPKEKIVLNYSEFYGANYIKTAYVSGLRITQ